MAKIYDFNREKLRRFTKWLSLPNGVIGARLPKLKGTVKPKSYPIDMSMFNNEDEVHIIHRHK